MNYNKNILDIIKNEVATYYHIPIEYLNSNMKGDANKKNVRKARQTAVYLSIKLTSIDRTIIANSLGIYDDDSFSARARVVHLYNDFTG